MSPYLIRGPALISFSWGRTSAYMLHEILTAHGGQLPDDVHVAFANTGKEREETLRFVHECESRWGVKVHWLEWRKGAPGFEIVGYNSAARRGEPFEALIASKSAVPNWQARWCTGFLKVRPMIGFMASLGHLPGTYVEALGLRADEPDRIGDMVERNERDKRLCTAPLGRAAVTKPMVRAFWREQPFDLALRDGEGNCNKSFLKGKKLLLALERDNPDPWWSGQEISTGATFSSRYSYAALDAEARRTPTLFDWSTAAEHDAECGLTCPA